MRYAIWADVVNRYSDAAKINQGQVDFEAAFIGPAENYIDSAFASRYTVPFCNTISFCPPFINDLAIDIAYYRAVGIRSKFAKNIITDISSRMGLINGGQGRIMSGSGTLMPTNNSGIFNTNEQFASSFGMDDPINWHVSSDWQADSAGNRQ